MNGDIFDEAFGETKWYPIECFNCKHQWMGMADKVCPKCGSSYIGVAGGCPEGKLVVDSEDEE